MIEEYCSGQPHIESCPLYNGIREKSLQELLGNATGCSAQYGGYPCNSCFHSIIEIDYAGELNEDVHQYWLAVLQYRGDYDDIKPMPKLIHELYDVLSQ